MIFLIIQIRRISNDKLFPQCAEIIKKSFSDVAEQFKLTPENCPSNPAFFNLEKLIELKKKNVNFFGIFENKIQKGFVAVEKTDNNLYYLEKLSVLPEFRHKSLGKKLVRFVFDFIKKQDGKVVSIAVMNDHNVLKKWYKNLGFIEKEVKKIKHLPFDICFMEKFI